MYRSYCTLFDKNYLYQGVALHDSLLATTRNFKLYALAMDDDAYAMLQKLNRDTLIPVKLDQLLTEEVCVIRGQTTHGQFCWVNQPLICEYLLDYYQLEMVTYLESDSYFFSDPELLFEELGSDSVSLVPHNFSSEFDNTESAGRFCVQFNAFRNDGRARAVLADWKAANFQYHKTDPRAYPGQTCLDDWPVKYSGVKVIENCGAGVAPWNVRGYILGESSGAPTVNGRPVVFYHFHQYGRLISGEHDLGSYPMTSDVIDMFYRPYIQALRRSKAAVINADPLFKHQRFFKEYVRLSDLFGAPSIEKFSSFIGGVKRKLRGRFNVFPDNYF